MTFGRPLWGYSHRPQKGYSVRGLAKPTIAVASSLSALTAIAGSAIAVSPVVSNPVLSNYVLPSADTCRAPKGAKTRATGNVLTGCAKPLCLVSQLQKAL